MYTKSYSGQITPSSASSSTLHVIGCSVYVQLDALIIGELFCANESCWDSLDCC